MPKSKPSRRRARSAHGQIRREEAAPPTRKRSRRLQTRVGWSLAIAGGILFLLGNIGARTGIVFLPFDPHHVFGQVGGAIIGLIGILVATPR